MTDAPPHDASSLFDAPPLNDRRRMRRARRQARNRVAEITSKHYAAVIAAFRHEIRATVRSASLLLISLLALEGLTLDDAVALIKPSVLWPRYRQLVGRMPRSPSTATSCAII
jgi:hypothetical protein